MDELGGGGEERERERVTTQRGLQQRQAVLENTSDKAIKLGIVCCYAQ